MQPAPFRETYTLSDAVEQIGRRLYGETWTGWEYMYCEPRKSPDEIERERRPLEEDRKAAEEEILGIDAAIRKTLNHTENQRLGMQRKQLETRVSRLNASLSLDHPLNEIVTDSYNTHMRCKTGIETLLQAIREFKLAVHDGRGHRLNSFVWSDPRFRYDVELSIVVNPRSSGEPRRQAARIDKELFTNWLATLKRLVEPSREPSPEEALTEFLRQQIDAARGEKQVAKTVIKDAAMKQISGLTVRMFERIWASVAPPEWRKPGARPKTQQSG